MVNKWRSQRNTEDVSHRLIFHFENFRRQIIRDVFATCQPLDRCGRKVRRIEKRRRRIRR